MSALDDAAKAVLNLDPKDPKLDLATNKVKLNGFGNLKAYYNELHDFLVKKKFYDTLEPGLHTKRSASFGGESVLAKFGEHIDAGEFQNRTADMYETLFRDVDLGGGLKEYEIEWEAQQKMPDSYFPKAKFLFKFKVVIRRCETKVFEEDGKKVEKQGGTWEFESKYSYINDVSYKVNNIPVIGHFNWSKELYYKYIYIPYVKKDILDALKMTDDLRGIARKYFSLHKK